jgi:hypothetical protein
MSDPLISKSLAIEAVKHEDMVVRDDVDSRFDFVYLDSLLLTLAALPAIPPPRDADENYALMYRIQTLEIENEKLRAALPAIPLDDKLERIMAFAANVRDAEQVSREFLVDGIAAILAGYDDAIPGAPVEPVPVPRSILQGMKFEALSDGFRVTPLEPIDFLGTECFFDGGKVGSWNIEGEIRFTYSAPVPAPRLEWREGAGLESTHWYGVGPNAEDEYDRWTVAHLYETYDVSYAAGRIQKRCKTLDAAKSLAEKLNDVLSPPVGTQEKEN